MHMLKKLLFILVALLVPVLLFAQTGKISGKIVDRETKEPLVSANVSVDGTTLGAVSDIEGHFIILGVPPGAYVVKSSYVGYQTITISNVRVSTGLTTELNFDLPPEAVQVPQVVIIADRPLVKKDQTNTLRVTTADEINTLPIRGTANVAALQASVVKNEGSNLLYIRGGRSEEVSYLVDGVSVNNPLSGNASAAFNNINQNAIEELQIQTGGFNAEYGSAMSGVINLNTKQGSSKYTAAAEVITDHYQKTKVGNTSTFGQSIYTFALGGPVIPDDNMLTFYLTGERQYLTDNDPRAIGGFKANSTTKSWNWNGKLVFRPISTLDVKVGGMIYDRSGSNWDNLRRFRNADHQLRFDNSTISAFARLTHNIDPNTFYEVQFGYFNENIKQGDGVWFDDLLSYGSTAKNPALTSVGTNPGRVFSTIDALGAVNDQFLKSKSEIFTYKADINRQEGVHLLKAGFEYRAHKIRRYSGNPMGLAIPSTGADAGWDGYRNNNFQYYGYTFDGKSEYDGDASDVNDFFTNRKEGPKTPVYFAGYLQDKIELSDLVLNLGLRMDYFNANEQVVKDPYNPFGKRGTVGGGVFGADDLEDSKGFTAISPRFGFSFPVTDRANFHAQYGTFLQMPPLQNVLISKTWEDRMMGDSPFSAQIPNPNLKPERTISYEIGYRQMIGDNSAITVTGFYKEIKDLIQARNFGSKTEAAYPNNYESYENVDFGTVKGFDIIFDLRRTKNFAATLNYTLGFANGTGSDPQAQSRISWIQTENPKLVSPLDFDRRHVGSLNLDYRLPANEGPKLGDIFIFERTGINLLFSFTSGVPYTRSVIFNPFFGGVTEVPPAGGVNQAYTPWTSRIDLRVDRSFTAGPLNMTVSLYVLNALNSKNVFGNGYSAAGLAGTIYRGTGEADNSGWLSTREGQEWAGRYGQEAVDVFTAREHDPANYGIPRQLRLGLRIEY